MTSPSAEVPTVRAFLSLGSNLGDRGSHLRRAVDQLRAGSDPAVTAVSRLYETEPVGGPDDSQRLSTLLGGPLRHGRSTSHLHRLLHANSITPVASLCPLKNFQEEPE